ncbi:response regulator transcription factor [Clostridium botulinum]|nr:response regulator transcription factor [Clostridium botulinum]MBO0527453.1 response regulator transcription factor [Clostridium botulinum]MBO0541012.1 response regulator transcription factor [Clostridium botulinum]MBO0549681.1 response regulator transcription factor [Clostridium botulinum]MBO0560624.1 response regulator transcription factor [Clostridium botulinum]MBO0562548.1 response regulator transcription factor [Clostridium botulinum]
MDLPKILLVEDDKNISEMVTEYLTNDIYEVIQVYDGESAIDEFRACSYDLVLLDLMIPKINGMNVMKKIREHDVTPIIIITAKDNDTDKAIGLGFGADDYLTKPFSLIELSARIKANIRRVTKYTKERGEKESKIIYVKNLKIDVYKHSVVKEGKELNLTNKEFEILKLLASNLGRVFSKEQIYNQVWEEPYYGEENVINVHMKRLRNKLSDDKSDFQYIRTLWGIGYKMEEK